MSVDGSLKISRRCKVRRWAGEKYLQIGSDSSRKESRFSSYSWEVTTLQMSKGYFNPSGLNGKYIFAAVCQSVDVPGLMLYRREISGVREPTHCCHLLCCGTSVVRALCLHVFTSSEKQPEMCGKPQTGWKLDFSATSLKFKCESLMTSH